MINFEPSKAASLKSVAELGYAAGLEFRPNPSSSRLRAKYRAWKFSIWPCMQSHEPFCHCSCAVAALQLTQIFFCDFSSCFIQLKWVVAYPASFILWVCVSLSDLINLRQSGPNKTFKQDPTLTRDKFTFMVCFQSLTLIKKML
jgi:hypothetical protein